MEARLHTRYFKGVGPEGQGGSEEARGENKGEGWGTGAKVSWVRWGSRKKVATPEGHVVLVIVKLTKNSYIWPAYCSSHSKCVFSPVQTCASLRKWDGNFMSHSWISMRVLLKDSGTHLNWMSTERLKAHLACLINSTENISIRRSI